MEIMMDEFETGLDAFDIYSIYKNEKNIIFLDSSMKNDLGKYSFIGVNPYIVLRGSNNNCKVNEVIYECDVFEKLSEILYESKIENNTDIPFIGGCIGYFSYDLGYGLEEINSTSKEDILIPQYYFVFYDNLIIFDHESGKNYISACGILRNSYDSIKQIKTLISHQKKTKYVNVNDGKADFVSNFTKEEYLSALTKMKRYIVEGDIYIANMTQRLYCRTQKDSYDIYRDLRFINPAPFSAFLRLNDFDIICSSPERFMKIHRKLVETRPIKGTRPRGKNSKEDKKNLNELINSEKDKAELLMIVDLERNDLSKVCKPNSVKVTELYKIEKYSTVFHLVATIVGELKDQIDPVRCIKACFPGGSITGTPKIRAMEIIDELEGIKRSIYTGCVGCFSFDGYADFNIVIRTILKKDDHIFLGVGGGITYESDEESEYQECLDKAKALLRVIR
jgi:para-aminobenzoate synthetase component 1